MTSYELEIQRSEDATAVYVLLSGELDLTNARDLELRLDEAAPADVRLVVDLNRVSFLDSAALHVLFKQARSHGPGGLVIVVEPTAHIARTLAIVGVDRAAEVVPSAASRSPYAGTG